MPYLGTQLDDTPTLNQQGFFGLRVETDTGKLLLDFIDDETMSIDINKYEQHFWTQDNIKFNIIPNGHMEATYK